MIWSEERELRPEKAPDLREVKLFEDIFKKRYKEAKPKDYVTGKKRRYLRLEKDPDPKSFNSNGLNSLCFVKNELKNLKKKKQTIQQEKWDSAHET